MLPSVCEVSVKRAIARCSMMLLVAGALVATGCQKKGPVPVAPKPRRPPAKKVEKPKVEKPQDCTPTVTEESPAAVPYTQRVIVESNNLSSKGIDNLRDARKESLSPAEREQLTVEGVEDLLTALKADPYNINATYYLAATYARIGRPVCSINLLERLALLRRLESQRPAVEAKVDMLLGREKYKGKLDSSFDDIRADSRFRDVVSKLIAPL